MDQDERQRKLEAGRAKLADFRQRRAKSNGSGAQKKKTKGKSQAVQANDRSPQESRLEDSPPDPDNACDNRTGAEESSRSECMDHTEPEAQLLTEVEPQTDSQEWSSVLEECVAPDQPVQIEDYLGEIIVTHTGKEQLKKLQAVVEKRDEIISQLSINLQVAIKSRDQVQLEAQQLVGQIQALQQQLQQAKEYLRYRTQSGPDQPQSRRNSCRDQHSPPDHSFPLDGFQAYLEQSEEKTKDQQCLLAHKEMAITDLHQKLSITQGAGHSDTDSLLQRLTLELEEARTELQEERQNSQRAQEQISDFQRIVETLERERTDMEAQLTAVRAELSNVESQAREAQQYKAEKEELNKEMARLDGLVLELQGRLREEEEAGRQLRSKYEVDISNYDLRLQTLEEERKLNVAQLTEAHEAALKSLKEEHADEVKRIQQLLERVQKAREAEPSNHGAPDKIRESFNSVGVPEELDNKDTHSVQSADAQSFLDTSADDQHPLMERYLASAPTNGASWAEESLEEHSLLECSGTSRFELDSEVIGEGSKLSHSKFVGDATNLELTFTQDSAGEHASEHGVGSVSHVQRQSFTSASQELNESSDGADLGKELLIQQCQDLTEQLERQERQLEILQEEVQRSAEEVEEARERWSKASEELEEARWELEAERERRLQCEEVISQKTHEQDNLKNKLSYLESQLLQQENEKSTLLHMDTTEKNSVFPSIEELVKELKEEKVQLLLQLKQQEQLVIDVQEQKLVGDSVSSEVQALFGRQLSSLQVQRDQLLAQLENQRDKNQATSALLGQRTLEVDSANKKLQELMVEMDERMERLQALEKDKTDLESKLVCLKQNMTNLEEALSQGAMEKIALESRLQALEEQAKSMEKILESELENFENQLEAKNMELEKAEEEHMEKESILQNELTAVRLALEKEEEERSRLEEKHQKEVHNLNLRLEREFSELKVTLEEEQRKQISLIKQVHEREHHRELDKLTEQKDEELRRLRAELTGELRDSMEAAHQAELLQAQTQQSLDLESLRLSLNNMHMAQLELSQANLQKDKEAALSELQASLRDKWAQESAMLQTRQQFELEKLREQNREQEQKVQQQHQKEIDDLRYEWETRLSEERTSAEQQQARKIEEVKTQLLQEAENVRLELQTSLDEAQQKLSETRAALAEAEAAVTEMQGRLEELQSSMDREVKRLEAELDQACADRDSAARAVEELVASHKLVLQEKLQHVQNLEEKEKQLQQEMERLEAEHAALKASSEQEVAQLWSQLESMRTSRQELGELKEQLLARSSRVDDIERLKQEFAQQRRDVQEQNEAELENLRVYFEQRLRASEESHREEIALLQLRLVEGALEESVLKTGDSSFLEKGEEESRDTLAEINQQLEKHKEELDSLKLQLEERHRQELEQLRSTLALSHREDLLRARTELTDRYYQDLNELKTKHALELEQLRAKLSDSHVKEITRLRLQSAQEVARQVEAELKERSEVQVQEHRARLSQLSSETERIRSLESQLNQLTQQHGRELETLTEKHREELQKTEEQLRQAFAEELKVKLEEAQREERKRVSEELTEERNRLQEKLQAQTEERLASLREELQRAGLEEREELEQRLSQAQELLNEESEKLRALQASLENEENPQVLAVKQRLQAQYDSELRTAKSTMVTEVKELNVLLQAQTETKLQEANSRLQEELKQLEEKLIKQKDTELREQDDRHREDLESKEALLAQHMTRLRELEKEHQDLKTQHQEELDSLCANHKKALEDLEAELSARHRAELDKLQAVLQETNLAQLEAQEAELEARHKQEREELEARMLSNMDTLESTLLSEIQAVRDEKEGALLDLRASLEDQHRTEMERLREEEQSIREELRRELAQVHLDKFSAMASELSQAHQEELAAALSSQKASLEADHCRALEALQQSVLDLERQHSAALQEITEMTNTEKLQLQQQLNTLTAQHQQQLQELRGVSARELEALRRELEEEASRQRLHFLEEAELLKCQSEEQLQQRITQLKEESERERRQALEEQERSFREQQEQTELGYRDKMSQLTAQLQELDAVVSQEAMPASKHLDAVSVHLRAEVSGLQGELEGKRSEMETLETLLQRRDRESQEGDNLLAMLRADLNTATQQRQDLQDAHDRLQRTLLEMLKNTMTTEELINQRIGACVNQVQCSRPGDVTPTTKSGKTSHDSQDTEEADGGVVDGGPDCSLWSSVTDEGLELSQRLCESLFSGPEGELEPQKEELVLGACTRLRSAVDMLLELVSQSTQQLEQTHRMQAALQERFGQGKEDAAQLLLQHSQLLEQLDQEASQKSQLQLELHKAEGLMDGYVAEKASLEETLQQKETQEQRLVEELERTRVQLHELSEEHALLIRQRDALSSGLGDTEKALLEEAERLGRERVDVQRQAEKDQEGLASRLRLLELTLEEQEGRFQEQEEQHRAQTEDLQQHIDALEKQLKHHRQFIDEQAEEREHERDEFQQEIKNLEAQLRLPLKGHAGGDNKGQRIEDLVLQVESLQAIIKDKMEDYSTLLQAKEQCQQDVAERNEEIDKLTGRIRELEQALLNSVESSRTVGQLEQDLQRAHKLQQDLMEDKEALQQQLYSNKLQISALQSKLDETRHRFPDAAADHSLREQLDTLQQDLQTKEQQAETLLEQVEEQQKALTVREEEVRQLTLQLELSTRQSRATEEQLQEQIIQLEETVSALRRQQEEDRDSSMLQLPAALLEEKNQEIDHLNQQIQSLQQEVDLSRDNRIVEEKQAEIEELRLQVEHLRGDQERLRQAKEEEVEQLHEVIQKLQEELSQLDPTNRHEVSDPVTGSEAGSPELSDFTWSAPHPHRGPEESLCQELTSQTLMNSRTRLRELQAELEQVAEEKEALQRLLVSQEEEYGNQVKSLGGSLGEERGKLAMLEQEASELRLQLEEKKSEGEHLEARVKELEDLEKKRAASLQELELRLKTSEERREEAQQELLRLEEEEVRRQQEEAQDALSLQEEKKQLEVRVLKLQQQEEESQRAIEALRLNVAELEEEVQKGRTDIATLETGKKELFMERKALRRREGQLQEEIERLKQEVTSKNRYIQELNVQLEERVTKHEEAQKEVLTCAEETLAKADAALREREGQLVQLRAEHNALREELASVKEGLSSSAERAEKLREEGQTKDRALADLEVHNQHLKAELRRLQEDVAVQEEELAFQQRELAQLRQRCSHRGSTNPAGSGPKHERFLEGVSREASLSSPEVLRRLEDCSQDLPSGFHASHLSGLSGLHDASLELRSKASLMEGESELSRNAARRPVVLLPPPTERRPDAPGTRSPSPCSLSVSENLSLLDSLDADKVQELENLDVTPSLSPPCSTSPASVPEWASDGYGSNVSSELGAKLKLELENTERLDAHFVEYLRCRGMAPAENTDSAAGSMCQSEEILSPELQAMLKKVYQESCRVLSLSHRRMPSGQPLPRPESAPPPSWQRERRALQETVLSLRELLCRMADREPKTTGEDVDWRRELLLAVRSVFDSEREWLHSQLQAVMATNVPQDHAYLLKQLEKLLQKQEEQQRKSLEQLLSADRSSLLAEVRSLHAQLHACTLQSQEQLQRLQSSLCDAQEHGTQIRHQANRQVEELESKLHQEQTMAESARSSLQAEQTRSAGLLKQLEAEQKVISELRAELEETSVQLHSACKSQQELQSQIHQLRLKLESEEAERHACEEAVEREQARVLELQEELHQERLSSTLTLEQHKDTQESLHASVDEQASRISQLSTSLDQERVTISNLRAELQIEQSRCEALVTRERERTQEAQRLLEEERGRCAGLSDALARQSQDHARRLEEEARRQEAASAHDRKFIQELRAQLDQERRQGEELAEANERLRKQALQGRRRLEEEAQKDQEEVQRLRSALDGLRAQKTEVGRDLEAERRRAEQLQVELDGLRERMQAVREKERHREEQRDRETRQEKQDQADRERRHERANEKLMELELLRQRDQQRLRQLQQTLADLEEQEKQMTSDRLQRGLQTSADTTNKQDSSTSLVERLLHENSELSERLSVLSEERVTLKHTVSCLERDLQNQKQVKSAASDSAVVSERLAWQREKSALQAALRKAEAELSKVTAGNENRPFPDLSASKMQRLYEKYLRAESYRKSLVYQKRYLLLLLGGFQDCEQATLALIARMGAQPSRNATQTTRPLNRFRTGVRVVIAILRLKFLTRKWQRAIRKTSTGLATVNGHGSGHSTGHSVRTEVLRQQRPASLLNSPPTRDHALSQQGVVSSLVPPVKSPFRLHNRVFSNAVLSSAERTLTPSQDQERSLTEYIQHLETIQQRLGGVRPGSPSVLPYTRKSDR